MLPVLVHQFWYPHVYYCVFYNSITGALEYSVLRLDKHFGLFLFGDFWSIYLELDIIKQPDKGCNGYLCLYCHVGFCHFAFICCTISKIPFLDLSVLSNICYILRFTLANVNPCFIPQQCEHILTVEPCTKNLMCQLVLKEFRSALHHNFKSILPLEVLWISN